MKNGKIWFLTAVAALGGFLFGFDTIVICGAEQDIQRIWNLSGQMHGWVVSSALWGTVVGSAFGGTLSDALGRRRSLFGVGVLYLVSAVWSALAGGPWSMIAARFIGGLGVGVSTIAAPIYISEIAPTESRGRMTALFQFNIVFGVIASLASNLLIANLAGPDTAWRGMLGAEAIPAIAFTALCPFLVESPRWLELRGSGRRTSPLTAAFAGFDGFFSRANLRPILLAFFVAFFNQLSGCNAINYFAPRIFEIAGFGRNAALVTTFGLGGLNFLSTLTGVMLIDRLGRKTLLVIGGIGYLISLAMASAGFACGAGSVTAVAIFLFMAAHAVGQGTVIWVLISEVFPQRYRAQGQSLGSLTHWLFAALVAYAFPLFAGRADDPSSALVPTWAIFAFFGVMMVFHLLWALFAVPETKGRKLEDIRL